MDKDTKPDDIKPEAAETPDAEKAAETAPVDLSALQGFDFGTSWSRSTPSSGGSRTTERRDGDRRSRGGPERKDRRPFKPGSFRKPDRSSGDEQGGRPQRSSTGQGRGQMVRPAIPRKVVEASFYPEDNAFQALCKALRITTITYELFDIARTILEKEERFYIIIHPAEGDDRSFFVVESDGLPFLTENAAKEHAMADCLEHFFTVETTEVEPPSGSFSSIRKCGMTGELLGPPNFHKIKKIMADHHATRLSNMPFAKFESRIETITEEEVISEWLEKMKAQTIYTLKPDFGEPRIFEDGETARAFVNANLTDKLVRKTDSVRLEGSQFAKVKDSLLKANLEYAWDRQKRFPLDSANLLRGRLRRQKFALYKKGSKGVSFVCAVKRKFRESDQAFSDPVQKLIEFIEVNPRIKAKELPEKLLGFATHAPEGEPAPELTEEQQKKLKAMNLDFQWLLKEGYIAEYSDGTVFSNPAAGPGQGVIPVVSRKPKKSTPKKSVSSEVPIGDVDEIEDAQSGESEVIEKISEESEQEVVPVAESEKKAESVSVDEPDVVSEQELPDDLENAPAEATPSSDVSVDDEVSPDSEEAIEEAIDQPPVTEEPVETKSGEDSDVEVAVEAATTIAEEPAPADGDEKLPSSDDPEPEVKEPAKK
jgi:hypothetical protein